MSDEVKLFWVKEVVQDQNYSLYTPQEYFPHWPNYKDEQTGIWKMNIQNDSVFMTGKGFVQWTQQQIDQWHRQHDPEPPVYHRQRVTKYQLIKVLENYYPDLLTELKAKYKESDVLNFYWASVNDLDKNNTDFKLAQQALGISDELVTEIFDKAEGPEPNQLSQSQA